MKYILLLLALLFTNCFNNNSYDLNQEIANIADTPITAGELWIERYNQNNLSKFDKVTQRELLKSVAVRKALYFKAKENNMLSNPHYLKEWEFTENKWKYDFLQQVLKQTYYLPLSNIKKYYRSNRSNFLADTIFPKSFRLGYNLVGIANQIILNQFDTDSLIENSSFGKYFKQKYPDSTFRTESIPKESRKQVIELEIKKQTERFKELYLKDHYKAYDVKNSKLNFEPNDENLLKFYRNRLGHYFTQNQYLVYNIQSNSKSQLLKWKSSANTLAKFKKIASQNTLHPELKSKDGLMGYVKENFTFPYGVGLIKQVFQDSAFLLAGTESSFRTTELYYSESQKKWNLFAVINKKNAQRKEFKRVKSQVKRDFLEEHYIDSAAVIVTFNDHKLTEQQFNDFLKHVSLEQGQSLNNVLELFVSHRIASFEIERLGYSKLEFYNYLNTIVEEQFWGGLYQREFPNKFLQISKQDELDLKRKIEPYLSKNQLPASYLDLALFKIIPASEYQLEYYTYPNLSESFRNGKKYKTPASNFKDILFDRVKEKYNVFDTIFDRLLQEFNYTVLVDSLKDTLIFNELQQWAFENYQAGNYTLALDQYLQLQSLRLDDVVFQDSVGFKLASIYMSLKKYYDALAQYRRLLYLYPENSNSCQVQFMQGFVLKENLNQSANAIKAFQLMIKKYPNCSIVEDARWMISNIKTNGGNAPKLLD